MLTGMEPLTLRAQDLTYEQVAGTIDHSLLRPELTQQEVSDGCDLAARYRAASVCVRPADVALAASRLTGTPVAVGTVIGFPHGAHTTAIKVAETRDAIANGATELDMVLNISWMRSGEDARVQEEIAAIVAAAREDAGEAAIVKVILENAYLDEEQKVRACKLSEAAGADYVKTSTGFAPTGATLEDLRLMRASVGPGVKLKAAGGIRTLDALLAAIEVGCARIGATATAVILDDYTARTSS